MRGQMLNPVKTLDVIKRSGVKMKRFAEIAGVPVKTLSEFLHGWRLLNDDQSNRIYMALKKIAPLVKPKDA